MTRGNHTQTIRVVRIAGEVTVVEIKPVVRDTNVGDLVRSVEFAEVQHQRHPGPDAKARLDDVKAKVIALTGGVGYGAEGARKGPTDYLLDLCPSAARDF